MEDKILRFEITDRCNMRCDMCWSKEWKHNDLSDKNGLSTLQERAEIAYLVIFLKYPTYYWMFRAIKRYLGNFGKEKKELEVCKERLT